MKNLFTIFISVFALCCVFSCDEANDTTSTYYDGLFTVYGESVIPEMHDTAFVVGDLSYLGLQKGDKALMRVSCFIDNVYGPKYARWQVDKLYEKIEKHAITKLSAQDSAEYVSPVLGIGGYYTYGAAWAWLGTQMLNVVYNTDGSAPAFNLDAEGAVNDTLKLRLTAKITDGEETAAKLLCYDLTTARNMIEQSALNRLLTYDTIYTSITMQYRNAVNDSIIDATIIGGKLANPF